MLFDENENFWNEFVVFVKKNNAVKYHEKWGKIFSLEFFHNFLSDNEINF